MAAGYRVADRARARPDRAADRQCCRRHHVIAETTEQGKVGRHHGDLAQLCRRHRCRQPDGIDDLRPPGHVHRTTGCDNLAGLVLLGLGYSAGFCVDHGRHHIGDGAEKSSKEATLPPFTSLRSAISIRNEKPQLLTF